jgi:hypothetical protein
MDGRFSGFAHDDIALSMSTDGGQTWSDPIKVNQTPTNIPVGNQQAFTPSVAVSSDGTVAVTYYDFRNNVDLTPGSGLPTDYWLVHASSNFTNPSSWTTGELPLTNTSFNMENAAPTSRGYFLGDYEGLAAAGNNFYALFAQAGSSTSDPSNIWFRDPPPASATLADGAAKDAGVATGAPTALAAPGMPSTPTAAISGEDLAWAAAVLGDSAGGAAAPSGTPALASSPSSTGTTTDNDTGSQLLLSPSDLASAGPANVALSAARHAPHRSTSLDVRDATFADLGGHSSQDPLTGAARV